LSAIALSGHTPLTYMVFPALIWAGLRWGQRGATLAVALAAGVTVWLTAHEVGAFVSHPITDNALSTQVYIAVAALTTLCLAAIVSERQRAADALAVARARNVTAAADERGRIQDELARQRRIGSSLSPSGSASPRRNNARPRTPPFSRDSSPKP
jgi:integral membrane sensor domain MASE1